MSQGKPKQATRYLKTSCSSCGWTCRATRKHLHAGPLQCPTACGGGLEVAA